MQETTIHRWVAGPTSADDAARSFRRTAMRRRGLWIYLGIVTLVVASLMASMVEASTAVRLAWGLVGSVVFTAAVGAAVLVVVGVSNRRLFRQRIRVGDELSSRFGVSSVELAGPLSRHELAFDGLTSIRRVGDWVQLRQVGSPMVMLWPAALFPDAELSRLRRVVEDRRDRSGSLARRR